MSDSRLPIVVIGGGAAGMATALAAAPAPVLVLDRAPAQGACASALAQGGIAAAVGPGDFPGAHTADTLEAGAHHNDAAAVRWLCGAAPEAIGWLEAQGLAFDRAPDGALRLGREGGHHAHRIVHAGGDATGAALVQALRARMAVTPRIRWRGEADVDALCVRDGRVVGVRARGGDGAEEFIEAAAVVLATGGIGALFARTSNPPGAEGSGLALALAAGAAMRDLEFMQFHPTGLAVGGHRLPLLTEALRGAGAHLQDGRGQPLMRGLHPLGDLAPRDVVARRVWRAQQEGGTTWLDAAPIAGDWTRRFPTVLAACLAHGLDPRRDPLPITPVAHFHMGGIATDLDGRTSLAGLYAVGEVACNGVHGANRLASNSLLEAVCCGRRLGARLAAATPIAVGGGGVWVERGGATAAGNLPALRELLWCAGGPVRDATGLGHALRTCRAWAGWQVRVAEALLRAALARTPSLGAHWRADAVAMA